MPLETMASAWAFISASDGPPGRKEPPGCSGTQPKWFQVLKPIGGVLPSPLSSPRATGRQAERSRRRRGRGRGGSMERAAARGT